MQRHLLFSPFLLLGIPASHADANNICKKTTGKQDGYFYTFWQDSGTNCLHLGRRGHYRLAWTLPKNGNLVAGMGWRTGSPTRIVRYRAHSFDPGANGYLALYGWTTGPLVEYYVVDNWGGFTPPGDGATLLGTVDSDGGRYRIYRTLRVSQPSIAGTATFSQYWSVRTTRRPMGGDNRISFANHVTAWRKAGLVLGTPGYQVIATEGYGSRGRADIRVRADRR